MPSGIYKRTKKHNKNISIALTNKKKSKEHNLKNRRSHMGQKAWNKGLTKETDIRVKKYGDTLSKIKKGIPNPNMTGKKHWNWLGGKSFEPYPSEWNKNYKEQIRKRDRYKCQLCNHLEKQCKKILSVHHIDYNKENLSPDNLIALCTKCHGKTNFNRDYWYAYFAYEEE